MANWYGIGGDGREAMDHPTITATDWTHWRRSDDVCLDLLGALPPVRHTCLSEHCDGPNFSILLALGHCSATHTHRPSLSEK